MYEDYSHFYLVMDLISGGEMFDHLSQDGAYSEADAARLIFEIASALAFLHGVGIIHADLKPENLMLCSRNRRGGTIKIIDFGCALTQPIGPTVGGSGVSESKYQMDTAGPDVFTGRFPSATAETGTTGYWPPERFRERAGTLLAEELTPAVDIWAVGVILYIMLMGFHPFDVDCDRSDDEVAAAIKSNPMPPMGEEYVGHLSESAKDLIRRLMEPDPNKRMTAYELLHHPWVQGETAATEKIRDSDKKLSKFQDLRYKLEASVFAVLVNQGHQELTLSEAKRKDTDGNRKSGVSIMKVVFDVFDEDGKGYVSAKDIGKVVTERTGEVLKTKDTNEFLKQGNNESELSLSDFSSLFSGLKHKHFPRGHYIFHAGDEGGSMYFLSSGKVEMQTRKGQLVAILRSGDFFGEGSLLNTEKKRFTTAKCATPVDVIEIKREEFDRYTKSSEDTKNELKRKWRARSLMYAKNLLLLERNLEAKTLKKGDVVYREGDKGTSMFRVDDLKGGELEVLHGGTVVHKYVNGDSFGESSLLFDKPRSSTVRCVSDTCHVHEMRGEDFMAVVQSTPDMAASLRNMCRKRLFKRAVKQFSLQKNRGLNDADIVAAFHDADLDHSGSLNVDEVGRLMHRMDPKFPMSEIQELMKFVDVDEDGEVSLDEFKRIFRQFEDEKPSTIEHKDH
jgi:serine/threonine protein kinase